MSIDLYLRCKDTVSTQDIESVVIPLGFSKANEGRYSWFETTDYASLRGCLLFVESPPNGHPPNMKTLFTSYTNVGRSYEDQEMQNEVIRKLRRRFGGSVYDPQERKMAYIPNLVPRLSASEKGCGIAYGRLRENLMRANMVVTDVSPEPLTLYGGPLEFVLTLDKDVLTNNFILPFAVSAWEAFLKDVFVAYVETRPDAQEKIYEKKSKLEYGKLKEIMVGAKTLAEVEAEDSSFQNLRAAQQVYKMYLGLDLGKILNKKRKYERHYYVVWSALEELIELRHRIVHSAHIEPDMERLKAERFLFCLESAGKLVAEAFLSEKGMQIDLDKIL